MFLGVDLKIPFWAVAIVAVGVVFWPMAHATTSILSGYQNMKRIFVTDVVGSIVKVVGAGTSILLGYGFFGPLAAILISFIVLVFLRIDVLQIGRKAGEKIDRSEIIKKYAFPALVASLSWALFINTPTIILTIFDSLRSSGIFAASMTLTNPLTLVPAIIASSIFPITSYLMGVRDHEKKQAALFSLVIRYAVMISVPLLLAYVFFAKALVLVFAQIQYLEAVDLIPIVGVAILVQGIGQIFLQNLFALGKTETNRNVYMATAGIFLATSVPLTMTMGIDGMIYSFLATVSCFALMGYFALRRSLAFKMPWRSIEKVAAASIIFFVILLTPAVMGAKALQLLPFLVIGASVYLWVLGKTRFYIKEDAAILKLLEKKLRPLSGQIAALRRFVERNCGEDFKSISVKAI
jgi:O-antigen/teichoic acid export membrane protein